MASDDVTPALTPEQWASTPKVYFREPTSRYPNGPIDEATSYGVELVAKNGLAVWDDSWGLTVGATERHALAALALHGQPFGFTHEMLDGLKALADLSCTCGVVTSEDSDRWDVAMVQVPLLIERIKALLPPKV